MAISVTVRRTNGTITTVSTSVYGSYRPEPGDYIQLSVDGVTAYYKVAWVGWPISPTGVQITIGAALPSDPPPPPPT